jgi:aminomethyltransferase
MSELQRTPLRDFHAAHGARLVDFAGWEMPVQYRSILEEHKAVRRTAGLFDVSHMGEVDIQGPEAARFLNHLVTNDVAKLFPGRVLYSPMCQPDGGVVDDLLVYMRGPEDHSLHQRGQHRQGSRVDPRPGRGVQRDSYRSVR